VRAARPGGLGAAVGTGPYDAQDGDDEQDGEGDVRTDEGGGEDGGHDIEGGRGGMGQRGEEADDGAGESREHERGEAARPDAGTGWVSVIRRLQRLACPSGDAARLCRVPWPLLSL